MGFLGGPTDRVGDSFNFCVHPLTKLCVSDMHLNIREKHACNNNNNNSTRTVHVRYIQLVLITLRRRVFQVQYVFQEVFQTLDSVNLHL